MRTFSTVFFTFVLLSACVSETESTADNEVVNVYSHRHYDVDRQIFEKFTEETGIAVNVVKAGADELIVRLTNEGEKSPADVLITVDAGRLVQAKEKGLFRSSDSEVLRENIPAALRDADGTWFSQTVRARILAYAPDRVDPEELSGYAALTDEKWKGRILSRSSANIYNQSLLASIIAHEGEAAAEEWARGVAENFARPPKGNDTDQIIAVASGQGDVAIVNSYYIGKLFSSDDRGKAAAAREVGVFFPDAEGRGTHINVSGAGVLKHAPNPENALRLLEFMSSPDIQKLYAEANAEFPVHPKIEPSEILKSWGAWKRDTLSLERIGKYNAKAVEIFDRAGWK